jgi:hypothetical protein
MTIGGIEIETETVEMTAGTIVGAPGRAVLM